MARGVKRKRKSDDASARQCLGSPRCDSPVRRDLLEHCYPSVQTLRDYVLRQLPGSSRLRRRKIESLGRPEDATEVESSVARLLDTTLVCAPEQQQQNDGGVYQQFLSFSQRGDESYVTLSDGISAFAGVQCEIVKLVVWLLFRREKRPTAWPKHLLCDGFRRGAREGHSHAKEIPGIYSLHPNSHVATLKQSPWPQLLALLGESGQKIMIDLLVGCSIFAAVEAGLGNFRQICGVPLSELELPENALIFHGNSQTASRKPSDITLIRSRIFYAKPALTTRGRAKHGYKHVRMAIPASLLKAAAHQQTTDVLNRCLYVQEPPQPGESPSTERLSTMKRNEAGTIKVMMYIFPRQFGLHNVFTSKVNSAQTAQKFHDYALREEEIASLVPKDGYSGEGEVRHLKLPKRLRGAARHLVRRLQILHARCSYTELLRHYCPTYLDSHKAAKPGSRRGTPSRGKSSPQPTAGGVTPQTACRPKRCGRNSRLNLQPMSLPPKDMPLVDLSCPPSHVSAFCQAVLSNVIPNEFWGDGDTMCHNKTTFMHKVDHFIKLRRFESMTLHEISQGLKVADLAWLRPPGQDGQRLCQTDANKRHEIFHEFLYYAFDSLLIPLISNNFYVTESNTHRYQVFYFRHDIWRLIVEPAMAEVKNNMFEEMRLDDAKRLLGSRQLGLGQLRLLPKGNKLRPIMNLRRRSVSNVSSKVLGPSINSVLGPVHSVLRFEKNANPEKLGSTLFSVNEMYIRVKRFKDSLTSGGQQCLYFAKVDVHAAFDTIPQAAAVELMSTIFSKRRYTITKHAEVQPGQRALLESSKTATRAIKRWQSTALADDQCRPFLERLESELGCKKKNTVFVESIARRTHDTGSILSLLAEHVENNIVKLGKKFYRQKSGIPQGSVLSPILCNYFYANFEMRHLGFLDTPDCLLMRLIDDFLLITLDKSKAVKFVETMHRGIPEYGVEINQKKTLINFDMQANDGAVCKVSEGRGFPYCGTIIDCQSLEITKDRCRGDRIAISSSLTVEFGRSPGQHFQRKMLNTFKIQSHPMFYDTSHNSTSSVLQSLRATFCETSRKMWAYIRCLPRPQQPSTGLIIRTIIKVADIAFLILSGKSRKMRYPQYTCDIRKRQVSAIAYAAFLEVLGQKQTRYGQVISWLQKQDASPSHTNKCAPC